MFYRTVNVAIAAFLIGLSTADTGVAQDIATGCLSRTGQLSRVQIGDEPHRGSCPGNQEVVHLLLQPSADPTILSVNHLTDMDGVDQRVGDLGRLAFLLSCSQIGAGLYRLRIDIENISTETIEWNNLPLPPGETGPWLNYVRQQEVVYPEQIDKARFVFTLDELNSGRGAFYILDLVLVPLGAHGDDPLGYCQFGGTVRLVQAEGFPP